MSQAEEYTARLSEVIGARPAGTVEEQQAAFMIEAVLADEAQLKTDTEEFNCNPDFELPKTICAIATVVLGIISLFLPLMVIPSIIITAAAAIVFALEVIGNAPLSSSLKRGISQNIVGKYIPSSASSEMQTGRQSRKRKVVIVAHYDTGKVRFELANPIFRILPILGWVEVAGMALVPIFLLIRLMSSATEGLLIFFNVLIGICIVIALIPIVFYILHQTAQFNVGANCNASGVAVMLETARRLGVEFPAMAAEAEQARLHGEEALLESGLVPEGAELTYDVEAKTIDENGEVVSEEVFAAALAEGESAAPAMALSAESEQTPVTFFDGGTGEHGAIIMGEQAATPASAAASAATYAAATPAASSAVVMPEPEEYDDPNVPEWYKTARKRANANKGDAPVAAGSAQRSKFADALDAAAIVSSNALHQMETTDAGISPAEQRLQQMRQSILGNASEGSRSAVQPTAGVDGYLASSTDAPTYESSMVDSSSSEGETSSSSAEAASEVQAASARAEAVSTRAEALAEDAEELAVEAQDLEDALAREQANLEAQAKANRTISFIPVEVDPEEIFQQNESLKTGNIDQKAVAAQAAASANKSTKPGRRSITLPSLSGAIEPVKKAHVQPAPLAEDEELAKTKKRRSRQEAISITLPSTTSESKKDKAEAQDAAKTGASAAKPGRTQEAQAAQQAGDPNTRDASVKRTEERAADLHAASAGRTAGEKAAARRATSASRASRTASDAAKTTMIAPQKSAQEIVAEAEAAGQRGTQHRHAHATDEDKVRAARGETIEDTVEETMNESVSMAGSFISATETSSFKPVGDELVAHIDEEDRYIDDVDDSDYADQVTQTGALAGPGYVSMPKGRMSRMFGRFRRKKEDDELSLKDSLGIDDSFDARSVGAARGGWESFREDESASSAWDDEDWNGGAFSLKGRKSENKRKSPQDEEGTSRKRTDSPSANTRKSPKRGVNPFGNLPLSEDIIVEEREAVQQFKDGVLDTEVWFVALGAELADNAGIKSFIREHKEELRGSIIIDLDGMGAGNLTLIEEEGKVRRIKASARIKRYVNKAASALGMRVESGKMNWRNSATYMIGRNGLPTIHLVGMENGTPAHAGKADDTFENLDLAVLEQNCDYLVELLRTI